MARNLIILHGGMKTKDRRAAIAKLTSIPETEERLVLAKMFGKRMSGYRAMGYSMGDHASSEYVEDDYVIEYDEEALRKIEDEKF